MSLSRPPFDPLAAAERVAARLCHELSGPIGALASALDATLGAASMAEALSVARESAILAVGQLQLLRAVFAGLHEPQDAAAFARLAGCVGRPNFRADLSGLDAGSPLPPARARLLLALLVLASESLPVGGVAALASDGRGGFVVVLKGERAAWPADLAASLADPSAAQDLLADRNAGPRRLIAAYATLLASTTGQRLSLLLGATADRAAPLLVSFALPTQAH
jgi:histidine phosphotransferase ChpT